MAEVLSFERGRPRDHGLNAYCRQAAGLQIALNVRWRRRYVETDRNASDCDSRLADRGLLQPGQVLSGRRLIAQLAARGAGDDVRRLQGQPRFSTPTFQSDKLDVTSSASVFRPPPGLELPTPTEIKKSAAVRVIHPPTVERPIPSSPVLLPAVKVAPSPAPETLPRQPPLVEPPPSLQKKTARRSSERKGKAFIEIFAGCARLSGACLERGLRVAAPIELLRGDWCDCTNSAVRETILRWLRSGRIGVCWLGTPCNFWSKAKKNKHGEGADVSRVLANFSVKVIDACRQCNIAFVIGNPASNQLFDCPPLARALRRAGADTVVFHRCRYRTSYLKPTRLSGMLAGLSSLALRCNCTLPHEQLCGLVRVGGVQVWKTSLAGKYPPRLCRAIAELVRLHLDGPEGLAAAVIEKVWDRELASAKRIEAPSEAPAPSCPARWRCEWASSPTFSMCGDSRERRLAAIEARRASRSRRGAARR